METSQALTIRVSGKTYYAALDPNATDVPREEGWPVPEARRAGRGRTFTYELTRESAEVMLEHLETCAYNFIEGTDPEDVESRAEGRACRKDAARIRTALYPPLTYEGALRVSAELDERDRLAREARNR